jgi:hypothetical protein
MKNSGIAVVGAAAALTAPMPGPQPLEHLLREELIRVQRNVSAVGVAAGGPGGET